MNLNDILKGSKKFVFDNSPAIMTAIGVAGVVSTAYLTGTATVKATSLYFEHERQLDEMPRKEATKWLFKYTWRLYLPAAVSTLATITCIVCANRIGNRRAAAMAAAYTISEKAFAEYKDKVVEKLGDKKEQAVRDEIQQDRVTRTSEESKNVIIAEGDVLCYEAFTGRYFKSNMEALKKAQNDTNYQMINDNYASLSDFYNRVGLPPTATSDEVGWNLDQLVELEFSTVLSEDGKPCIAINFLVSPIRNYYKVN